MKIGGKIIHFSSLSSTNDVARELSLRGEEEGTVILADVQTKGRGTKGRAWYSAPSLGLYVSLILRPSRPDLSLLPLAMGLACREAMAETYNLKVHLKWPNDLIIDQKKVGGLLIESSFSGSRPLYAILGFGLNLNHETEDFPEELREKAISLRQACGRKINREDILNQLWPKIDFWYGMFLAGQDERIIQSFEEHHLFPRGEKILVDLNGQEIAGLFDGFSRNGALILLTSQGRREFTTGEVSLKK